MKLLGYDFTIMYNPGSKNTVADALSRRGPDSLFSCATLSSVSLDWDVLIKEVKADPYLSKIRTTIESRMDAPYGFTLLHDRLYYKGRFVVAKSSPFIPVLFQEYHDSPSRRFPRGFLYTLKGKKPTFFRHKLLRPIVSCLLMVPCFVIVLLFPYHLFNFLKKVFGGGAGGFIIVLVMKFI